MNVNKLKQNGVFIISLLLTLIFIVWGVFFTDSLTKVTDTIYNGSIDYLGWVYIGATLFFVIFSLIGSGRSRFIPSVPSMGPGAMPLTRMQ